MKKNYVAPTVEVFEYSVEDTLLASGVRTGMMSLFGNSGEGVASAMPEWLS
ncbi:MAG: hypothetical protein IJO74_03825 [Clostridia bacterium]|nr:hypothetical protein [Clostridia bacterium]